MTRRSTAFWMLQVVLGVAIAVFVWRAIARNWEAFRGLEFDFALRPSMIALSALAVLGTYAMLIEAWRRVLGGWDQRLAFGAAARIWTLANLGRYLPGKVWSIAGLAVLAQRAGVTGWAAAGSAIAMQAVALGTGVAIVAATAPGAASPLWLAVGAVITIVTIGALATPAAIRALGRFPGGDNLRPLALPSVVTAALVTAASWVAYGAGFWLLARGLFGPTALTVPTAVGVFAAGYIIGLLSVFAPGGVGVREVVFIGLLAPALGSGGAVALSIASRLLLTITELAAAAAGTVLGTGSKEQPRGS
ncbi:MAG TPA: hypothetical protein VGA37_04180 [Gemmatimonadales bacterium]